MVLSEEERGKKEVLDVFITPSLALVIPPEEMRPNSLLPEGFNHGVNFLS